MAKEQNISINTIIDRLYRHPLLKEVSRETIIESVVDFMRIVGVPNMFGRNTTTVTVKNNKAKLPSEVVTVITVRDAKTKKNLNYIDSISSPRECGYKLQNNTIYTTLPSIELEVEYSCIPVDKDGLPMIPDNASFIRAVEAYIKKNYFTMLVELGQMHPSILQNASQEYAWAVGDCESEFKRMNLDEADSFYKMWKSIVVNKPIV